MLFAAQGFQNTRMAQISDAARIKVGQIYRDFDGKEAIVADIVRADLMEFLDEPALDEAIASRDPAAVRHWLGDFIRRDCDPAQGRLLSQILVESARNARIACLLQRADERISANLARAIAAIAPARSCETARARLVDVIMVLIVGLPQRQLAAPGIDVTATAASFSALVEREIDRLLVTDA
ncbi:TetR/AcrR family transcriptional regulator [Sphingomonas sp. BIUV-7]|uniref:TetR/AcrR family transcriptional regulator n=1 Tax=Sphingomonas natans TaxID=3063330 RepID=A0ABT8YDL9_9SPHN|nr:TetR/AcrR family transcriptional regulator [Sphingomonas sp. BIUV-7]MDO6416448.1 TetR/AcrR family transcriptional regulator [Sphingomonas sp. BIUV-7]